MNDNYIKNVVEAALLAAGRPLQLNELTQLFDENARPEQEALRATLQALEADYSGRGIEVKETATGFRIQVRKEMANEVSRLWPERPPKYSRALLETLALIAYRQPITRAEIEAVRGVAVNPNIIKTVIERNWVRVVGTRDVPGRPELLGTTKDFLDYFGLRSLEDLPPLAELKAMGEINLQLDLAKPGEGGGSGSSDGALGSTEGGSASEGESGSEAERSSGSEGGSGPEGSSGSDDGSGSEGGSGPDGSSGSDEGSGSGGAGGATGSGDGGDAGGTPDDSSVAAVGAIAAVGVAAVGSEVAAEAADDASSEAANDASNEISAEIELEAINVTFASIADADASSDAVVALADAEASSDIAAAVTDAEASSDAVVALADVEPSSGFVAAAADAEASSDVAATDAVSASAADEVAAAHVGEPVSLEEIELVEVVADAGEGAPAAEAATHLDVSAEATAENTESAASAATAGLAEVAQANTAATPDDVISEPVVASSDLPDTSEPLVALTADEHFVAYEHDPHAATITHVDIESDPGDVTVEVEALTFVEQQLEAEERERERAKDTSIETGEFSMSELGMTTANSAPTIEAEFEVDDISAVQGDEDDAGDDDDQRSAGPQSSTHLVAAPRDRDD